MPYSKSPNGSAGGRFTGYAASWWHNSFNLHHFQPYFLYPISAWKYSYFSTNFAFIISIKTFPSLLLAHPFSALQIRPNLRFRFLSPNFPFFFLQCPKSPQTRPQGQFNDQQSHFNKCCNSRKEKDTILTCTASSFCLIFLYFSCI